MSGCSTYQQQNKAYQYWRRGDVAGAEQAARAKAEQQAGSKDAIIWRLEQAAVLRAAGKYAESNEAFDQVQDRLNEYSEEAKTKLANEAGALLSNQANLPYRGRAYDGIMLNTYKALNYLQLGDPDKARVELIRAYQRQQDAVEEHKRQIEKNQEAVAQQKPQEREMIDRAEHDSQFKEKVDNSCSELNQIKVYADYVNPFAVYLDGLFYMANATSQDDLGHARKSLERVKGFVPDNPFVKTDLEALDGVLQGKAIPPTTYVIFETGCAPQRGQIRIDIPTYWQKLPYLGASFPRLQFEHDFLPSLQVSAGGAIHTTALLGSMDSAIAHDFKNELPTIITKTLISSALKAAATRATWEATRKKQPDGSLDDGGLAGALVLLTGTGYQVAVNIADLRTWTTLPKEFQVCRVPTPEDRKLEFSAPNGGPRSTVTLCDGTYNLVYVKSISSASPLLVSQTKLK